MTRTTGAAAILGLISRREGRQELPTDLVEGEAICTPFGYHDYVEPWRKLVSSRSEDLFHAPFDSIASYGSADLLADRDSKSGLRPRAFPMDEHEAFGVCPPSRPLHPQILPSAAKAYRLGIRVRSHGLAWLLGGHGNGQLLAPFGTTATQDGSASRGSHPCPESMPPLPALIAWLVRSLHEE
jgi:hypothetical protein